MITVLQRRTVNASTMGSQNVTQHLVDYLHKYGSINVKKIFSPEHGFRGKADAGELVKDGVWENDVFVKPAKAKKKKS